MFMFISKIDLCTILSSRAGYVIKTTQASQNEVDSLFFSYVCNSMCKTGRFTVKQPFPKFFHMNKWQAVIRTKALTILALGLWAWLTYVKCMTSITGQMRWTTIY